MFKDILIPVEISDPATWKAPLAQGIEIGQQLGARLHVLTVVPSFNYPMVASFFPADFEQRARERVDKELHKFVAERIPKEIVVQTIVAVGTTYEQILQTADDLACDMIIMGRSSESRHQFMLGSNAERVVRHAKVAVLVLH